MSKTLIINPTQLSAVLGYTKEIVFDALVERLGQHVKDQGCVTYAATVKVPPIPSEINKCIWAMQFIDDLIGGILKQLPPTVRFEIRIFTNTLILVDIFNCYKESFSDTSKSWGIKTDYYSTNRRSISSIIG